MKLRSFVPMIMTTALTFVAAAASSAAFAENFSDDFAGFLATTFPRQDFSGASLGVNSGFGGKVVSDQSINHRPVILIHGSTDRAVGGHSGGWSETIRNLQEKGYEQSEIYALTWGDGKESSGVRNNHSEQYLMTVRLFIEAVLSYTGAEKVDVIGHSMGVTLARRAIKGGSIGDSNIGVPLTDRVQTFIGIAGANRGVGSCLNPFSNLLPTCSKTIGFHPDSTFLANLNQDQTREGEFVYSLWSNADDVLNRQVIGTTNPVPAQVTSPIPGETGFVSFDQFSHLQVRDLTFAAQWDLLSK